MIEKKKLSYDTLPRRPRPYKKDVMSSLTVILFEKRKETFFFFTVSFAEENIESIT